MTLGAERNLTSGLEGVLLSRLLFPFSIKSKSRVAHSLKKLVQDSVADLQQHTPY